MTDFNKPLSKKEIFTILPMAIFIVAMMLGLTFWLEVSGLNSHPLAQLKDIVIQFIIACFLTYYGFTMKNQKRLVKGFVLFLGIFFMGICSLFLILLTGDTFFFLIAFQSLRKSEKMQSF